MRWIVLFALCLAVAIAAPASLSADYKAHVYSGWESSLYHTEGDDGIPVPLAPDLGLNQGRVREVAAADCLDEDTARRVLVKAVGAQSGPSVQWPEPHFKQGTFRYYYGVHCAN